MANITNVNELWGRKWRFKDDTPSPSEFSLRNSVTGVKFATFYLGEQVKDVYQTDNSVGNVGITTQGTFIRIGVSESSFTYAYAASGWVGKPAILEFVENTENYTLSCTNESNFITWFNENATEYVPPLSEWTKGVADAIREKKGTSDLIKPLDFAKEIINIKSGGGSVDTSDATATLNDILLGKTAYVNDKKIEGTIETWNGENGSNINIEHLNPINGTIKEYNIMQNEVKYINEGDFVEIVKSCPISCSQQNSSNIMFDSVLLDENKMLIVYINGGIVLEIVDIKNNVTINTINCDGGNAFYTPSCVLLEPNKVFIAIAKDYSDKYFCGMIVEINDDEISYNIQQLSDVEELLYSEKPSCVLLESNKVFIAHNKEMNSEYLCGSIVEINGTEMKLTTTVLSSINYSCCEQPSCVLLEPNKVFIAHSVSWQNHYLYGTIVTIDGTTMVATTKQLNSSNYTSYSGTDCVLLEPNKVFIARSYNYKLAATIVDINETTMTVFTNKDLDTLPYSCYGTPSCIKLKENEIVIFHPYLPMNYLAKTSATIDKSSSDKFKNIKTEMVQKNYYRNTSGCLDSYLLNDKFFIVHNCMVKSNYANYVNRTIYPEPQVRSCVYDINGVAKTSGEAGDTIQVFVPETEV